MSESKRNDLDLTPINTSFGCNVGTSFESGGFTPEQVTPEMLFAGRNACSSPTEDPLVDIYLAMRAKDPGIAELTEALQNARVTFREIREWNAEWSENYRFSDEEIQHIDAVLAKIGGNHG